MLGTLVWNPSSTLIAPFFASSTPACSHPRSLVRGTRPDATAARVTPLTCSSARARSLARSSSGWASVLRWGFSLASHLSFSLSLSLSHSSKQTASSHLTITRFSRRDFLALSLIPVSYTHLRAHETEADL
eukprot:3603240-Rhodomonas_salina.4